MIYLIKKLNFVITILILLTEPFLANATENRILYKVNNEIITSYDLKKEFKYLSIINPTIINLEKNEIFEVSKNLINYMSRFKTSIAFDIMKSFLNATSFPIKCELSGDLFLHLLNILLLINFLSLDLELYSKARQGSFLLIL